VISSLWNIIIALTVEPWSLDIFPRHTASCWIT